MYCSRCGNQIPAGAVCCPACGAPAETAPERENTSGYPDFTSEKTQALDPGILYPDGSGKNAPAFTAPETEGKAGGTDDYRAGSLAWKGFGGESAPQEESRYGAYGRNSQMPQDDRYSAYGRNSQMPQEESRYGAYGRNSQMPQDDRYSAYSQDSRMPQQSLYGSDGGNRPKARKRAPRAKTGGSGKSLPIALTSLAIGAAAAVLTWGVLTMHARTSAPGSAASYEAESVKPSLEVVTNTESQETPPAS